MPLVTRSARPSQPRHVWVLVVIVVSVLGFAIGGALRSAVAFGSSAPVTPGLGGTAAQVRP